MNPQPRAYLFLMREADFETAKKEHAKFRYGIFSGTLLETIEYDGEAYNLYRINTDSINPMAYASAVMDMGGTTQKNRFTGAGTELPAIIKQLFDRHIKSAGGSETK